MIPVTLQTQAGDDFITTTITNKMKNQLFPTLMLLITVTPFFGCTDGTTKEEIKAAAEKTSSPTASIDGAWELVWENVGTP